MAMTSDQLTPDQALAVLQAMYKAIGEAISTKNPYSLRSLVDQQMYERYQQTGMLDKIIIKDHDGNRLGTIAAIERPAKTTVRAYATDENEFFASVSPDDYYDFVRDEHADEFIQWVADNGIKCEGLAWRHETVPASWGGTRLTGCKPVDVLPALAPQLAANMTALLPEGVE